MPGRSGEDPRHTGALPRGLAAAIDTSAALVLAVLLSRTAGVYFAERAVETLRIGQPDSAWKGTLPMLLGAVSTVAYGVAFALLLIWLMEALFGTSPGKLVLRREIAVRAGRTRIALWRRFAVKTSGAWLFCVALALESLQLAMVATLVSAVVLLGLLPVAAGRPTLHDRMCSTSVVERARRSR